MVRTYNFDTQSHEKPTLSVSAFLLGAHSGLQTHENVCTHCRLVSGGW